MKKDLNSVIEQNEKLIYSIINKYSYYFNIEDLYQVAIIGLINAYKNYKENQNTKFSTYAYFYIFGEVANYIRETNYFKVSKELTKLNKSIEKAKELLTQKLNRIPTVLEISAFLEIDIEKIEEANLATTLVESLDNYEEETCLYNYVGYSENSYNEDILDLKEEISRLSPFEQQIIENRYQKGYTQSETSEIMGLNQTKVYRTEKEILSKLRVRLR